MGQPDSEVARSMYRVFVESLEIHYSEMIKFLAILIPSLTGYGVILYQYALAGTNTLTTPLLMVTIIVIIMQVWGAWSALAMSYRFRYLQLAVSKIERHFRVETLLPERFQASRIESRKDRMSLQIAPEILRVHVSIFIVVVLAVSIASIVILHEAGYSAILAVAATVAIGWTMYLGAIAYPSKYNDLFRDTEAEHDKAAGNGGRTVQWE
jgi:hypothetical protein